MKRTIKLMLMIGLPVVGLIAGYLLMARTVEASVDGVAFTIRTHALTVGGAFRSAGYPVAKGDAVQPAARSWLSRAGTIQLDRSRLVRITGIPGKESADINTSALTVAEVFEQAGIALGEQDCVLLNGSVMHPTDELPQGSEIVLGFRPSVTIQLNMDGNQQMLESSAANLGIALWQAGIRLREGDRVSPALDTPLGENLAVEIRSARPITITVDSTTIAGYSAAQTVAEALAERGVMLQDQDYARPGADDPLPEDGLIQVVRVTEEILSEQRLIPFETESLADDTMFMNERTVSQTGVNGLVATRVKVRYEDGIEVGRETRGEVLLSEPVTQIEYYGTKLLESYIDTPAGALEYYMTVDVVATSYSPCRSGVPDKCYPMTSLGLPVQKGVAAVHLSWYRILKGTKVYVPGYGVATIADTGVYPYNDNWIDLGYSDADYVPWGAVNVTIYLLSPAPPGFTGVLP